MSNPMTLTPSSELFPSTAAARPKHHAPILPMDATSVQRIVAGQAITDLASAIKELVDNALDAGSTTINIRLFNQGLDIVEVSDDGCGVPVESRPYMAMKHATSKIKDFNDIYSTDSLGFRGEALFCLANISHNLVVATRTATEVLGQKLEYTREGYLRGDTVCPVPRKVGTTVAVVKLFDALPVRRADLVKRIQAQRREVFLMVQGYALHCLGIKFNLFDISDGGREELRLSTMHGTVKLEQTISSVLGSSFLSGMSPISIELPLNDTAVWRVEGLIAKAPTLTARDGSVARNAQFFSINGRPVDLPRISKSLSEAWRTLEGATKKKPACVLQFFLPKSSFDVNLSPNKRQVLMTDEKLICDMIYKGVLAFWSSQRDGKFLQNELDKSQGDVEAAGFESADDMSGSPEGRRFKRRLAFVNDLGLAKLQHHVENDKLQGINDGTHSSSSRLTPPLSEAVINPSPKINHSADASPTDSAQDSFIKEKVPLDKTSDAERRRYLEVQERFRKQHHELQDEIKALQPVTPDDEKKDEAMDVESVPLQRSVEITKMTSYQPDVAKIKYATAMNEVPKRKAISLEDFGFQPVEKKSRIKQASLLATESTLTIDEQRSKIAGTEETPECGSKAAGRLSQKSRVLEEDFKSEGACQDVEEKPEEKQAIHWDSFQGTDAVIQASRKARLELRDRRKRIKDSRLQREETKGVLSQGNDDDNDVMDTTEESTHGSKVIVSLTKKDFEEMQVIGQFNLGFILAKCRNNNIWILDQHACDEKYNFERLCATTVMHEQKLLAPMPLELSPAEEACVLDNMETFEQNGFRFQHDPDKPPRHRLSLTSLPHSGARDGRKAVQFGKDDVRALCAVLGADSGGSFSQDGGTGVDGNGVYGNNAVRRYAGLSQNSEKVMTRLPKAVAMFANRACRGSVMIGTALSKKEMEVIVQRLANVQHPWNCPHGRPTLKHLCDLLGATASDERRTQQYTTGPTFVAMPDMTQPDEAMEEELTDVHTGSIES